MDQSLIAALQEEYEVPVGFVDFSWHDAYISTQTLYEVVRKQSWCTSRIDARMEVVHLNIDAIAEYESHSNHIYCSPEFVIEWWLVGDFCSRTVSLKTTPQYMWETAPMSLLRIICTRHLHARGNLLMMMISAGEVELAIALLDGEIYDSHLTITNTSKLETRRMHTLIPLLHLLPYATFYWPGHKRAEFYACCRQLNIPLSHMTLQQVRRVFALIMGVQDDYLKVRPWVVTYTQSPDFKLQFTSHAPIALRFFDLARRLPAELQWHLACAVIGQVCPQRALFDGDVLWMLHAI